MPEDWEYLELGDLLLIAEAVTGLPADILAASERVLSQADSALHVPGSGFGNVEIYSTFAEKAAILCARIIQNHPVADENKRTAFMCMVEFIEMTADVKPFNGPGVMVAIDAVRRNPLCGNEVGDDQPSKPDVASSSLVSRSNEPKPDITY
jgi:Fic/DOC family